MKPSTAAAQYEWLRRMYGQAPHIVGMGLESMYSFQRVVVESTDLHIILKQQLPDTEVKVIVNVSNIEKMYDAAIGAPSILAFSTIWPCSPTISCSHNQRC